MNRRATAAIQAGSRIRPSVNELPSRQLDACLADWRARVSSSAQAQELEALQQESDPHFFYQGLTDFAARMELGENPSLAADIYATLAESTEVPTSLRSQAKRQLAAWQGRGSLGPRAEVLLRRWTQETLEPSTLFAMAMAGPAFEMTRLLALRSLASLPAGIWSRGIGARSLASLAGFAAEAPTFTLAGKIAGSALGRNTAWDLGNLKRDLASSFLVLGGLKLGAGLSNTFSRSFTGESPAFRSFLPASGTFSGILLGHALETRTGLRPDFDDATTLIDSLALLLQFHAVGKLGSRFLGLETRRWHDEPLRRPKTWLDAKLSPQPAMAMALGPDPLLKAQDLNIFMEGNHGNEGSPRPIPLQEGSEAAPDQGLLGKDAAQWGQAQNRSSQDVRLVAHLAARIRVEMWNALNLHIEGSLARAIARGRDLLIRIVPLDGSLENYNLEMYPKGKIGPQVDSNEVRFLLQSSHGSLKLQDHLPNAVWEMRWYERETHRPQGFLPFYRSIQGFSSSALKTEAFLDSLSSAAREYVLMDPTQELRRAISPEPSPPEIDKPSKTKVFSGPTLLVRYFPRIMAGVRESADRYLEEMMIRGEKEKKRLHGLVQNILLGLHQREIESPEIGQLPNLQIWLRPSAQGQGKRTIEVLSAGEAFAKNQEHPYGPSDVLLILHRDPIYSRETFPVLEHQYLRRNPKNPRLPSGEDIEFQRDLGLGDHLRFQMRVDDLSLSPPDLASWQRWMQEHDPAVPDSGDK